MTGDKNINMDTSYKIIEFRDWLRDFKRLSESSINIYASVITKFFIEYEEDTLDNINWFIAEYANKSRSVHYFSVMKSWLEFSFRENRGAYNEIVDNLVRPRRPKNLKTERQYLKDDDIIEILNHIKHHENRIIALIQFLTAARAGDVISVRRDMIQHEEYQNQKTLKIVLEGKGGKRNVVYIFDTIAIGLIDKYLEKYDNNMKRIIPEYYENFVFIKKRKYKKYDIPTDGMMIRRQYYRYWKDLGRAIELSGVVDRRKFATHDFRRCFARKVWEKHKDVDILKRALNHEDASTTLRYLRQSGLQNIEIFKDMTEE